MYGVVPDAKTYVTYNLGDDCDDYAVKTDAHWERFINQKHNPNAVVSVEFDKFAKIIESPDIASRTFLETVVICVMAGSPIPARTTSDRPLQFTQSVIDILCAVENGGELQRELSEKQQRLYDALLPLLQVYPPALNPLKWILLKDWMFQVGWTFAYQHYNVAFPKIKADWKEFLEGFGSEPRGLVGKEVEALKFARELFWFMEETRGINPNKALLARMLAGSAGTQGDPLASAPPILRGMQMNEIYKKIDTGGEFANLAEQLIGEDVLKGFDESVTVRADLRSKFNTEASHTLRSEILAELNRLRF